MKKIKLGQIGIGHNYGIPKLIIVGVCIHGKILMKTAALGMASSFCRQIFTVTEAKFQA
jgi:hypothetical protein